MKQFKFTIGLPFSGKSTLAKKYKEQGWEIIERDAVLKEIIDSPEYQAEINGLFERGEINDQDKIFSLKNKIATDKLNAAIKEKVLNSKNDKIFYDGTNLQKMVRAGLTELTDHGVKITGVLLDVPIEIILDRAKQNWKDKKREGNFNEGAFNNLERMARLYERPDESENFLIEIVKPNQESSREFQKKQLNEKTIHFK